MKQKKDIKTASEKSTSDNVGTAYELGAQPANTEPLEQSDNWSTADSNMANQRREAHQEALNQEAEHYAQNHPDYKPKPETFETSDVGQPTQPTRSYLDTKIEMSQNLTNRRKAK